MGLSEIKRKILLKNLKEKKKLEIMFKEFEKIYSDAINLKKEMEKFQKRWGKYLKKQPEILNLLMRELLGLKGFENNLTMKIELDILELAKNKNITLIKLSDLVSELREKNSGLPITIKEIEKALKSLKKKNLIVDLVEIEGIKYVQLKDFEDDIKILLETFKEKDTITVSDIINKLGWDIPRIEKVLEKMVSMGLLVKEDYPPRYHIVKF